ncbi:type II toxin-antitoxin system Phd/YefM family antitoxin [Microcoleus sp. MON2_D6]|uniref:type II toxin-antitoxin system Phd/YefM family antitoxin n=1 Tax=unclassified Microcoleus TaxID=2642155 RepID=UPI002FD7180E
MIPINEAQKQLQQLIDAVSQSHQPIVIAGQTSNTVLLSESDWASVQEGDTVSSLSARDAGINSGRNGNGDRGLRSPVAVVNGNLVYTKQAQKDAKKLVFSNLRYKA